MKEDDFDACLRAFVKESNRIEGITRPPTAREIGAHKALLALPEVTVEALCEFVQTVAKRPIRDKPGMNVCVGNHRPIEGGPHVPGILAEAILPLANKGAASAYDVHRRYEDLHPFMDGNGRSGRALWLWQMLREGRDPYALRRGFLHTFYYQTLAARRP